jgi:alpha-N-arabinofuranosidase
MQGTALSLHVTADAPDDAYTGPTVPAFVARLTEHTPPAARLTKWIDASGVLSPDGTQVRVAIVNRHQTQAFSIPIVFGPDAQVAAQVSVHEVWSADFRDRNGFEGEKVRSVERAVDWQGVYECKKHSFQGK